MEGDELRAWLVLNASGLTVDRQLALVEAFGGPLEALAATDAELAETPRRGGEVDSGEAQRGYFTSLHVRKLREAEASPEIGAAERLLGELGAWVLPITDESYPASLREIDLPPPVLFVQGELRPVDDLAVAIVGTRKCTPYGRQVTRRLAYDLAARGVTVVSGMALGIDGEAHEGALEAGGRTVAVFGCGLDITYPSQHKGLRERIAAQGELLTRLAGAEDAAA